MYTVLYRIRRYDEKRSVDGASRNRPSKSNGVIYNTYYNTDKSVLSVVYIMLFTLWSVHNCMYICVDTFVHTPYSSVFGMSPHHLYTFIHIYSYLPNCI